MRSIFYLALAASVLGSLAAPALAQGLVPAAGSVSPAPHATGTKTTADAGADVSTGAAGAATTTAPTTSAPTTTAGKTKPAHVAARSTHRVSTNLHARAVQPRHGATTTTVAPAASASGTAKTTD
jgi:hypothetical protein